MDNPFGTGFGGDPLDPKQWLGGIVLPRTIAQNIQDDKDRKIDGDVGCP